MYFNAGFLIYFNTALGLSLLGVVKNETRLNSWTCANIRKLLCQKNINESLFCHSSDTIPLVLYNELCRIMNTDSMIDNVQFIEVRFHAQISNGVEIHACILEVINT